MDWMGMENRSAHCDSGLGKEVCGEKVRHARVARGLENASDDLSNFLPHELLKTVDVPTYFPRQPLSNYPCVHHR